MQVKGVVSFICKVTMLTMVHGTCIILPLREKLNKLFKLYVHSLIYRCKEYFSKSLYYIVRRFFQKFGYSK